MKKIFIFACLFYPVALANAAHNANNAKLQSGNQFSKFLKHKITPQAKRNKRKQRRKSRKKSKNVQVKVYATQQYTVDLLVTCNRRNILLTYNKIDKKFCTKKYKCHTSLRRAIRPYCK